MIGAGLEALASCGTPSKYTVTLVPGYGMLSTEM